MRCALLSKLVYIREEVLRFVNMRASNTTSIVVVEMIIISARARAAVVTEIESLELLFLCTNTDDNSSLHF